jgi:hypothetical protein
MKRLLPLLLATLVIAGMFFLTEKEKPKTLKVETSIKKKKKTQEERRLFAEERVLHEFNMQKNPLTGEIPLEEKEIEFENSLLATPNQRTTSSTYTFRGPSNLGGRTRALVIDVTDATSNTILAGGVSGGVFRTTNGGTSWTKVSANDEIHNVTALAQDPRTGFQNIWYYGTGEWSGNSASLGTAYRGQGIWKSTDSGVTWSQIPGTDSALDVFDTYFDYIMALDVNPINGDLLIAATGKIARYDGTNITVELEEPANGVGWTDVTISSNGRVYATIEGNSTANGVYTSANGNGSWTRIAQNNSPVGWSSPGRIILAYAPSNNDIVYALYVNGVSGGIEADLWQYNFTANTWTDYSSTLPDEPGGNLAGNDPFAVQGGYSIAITVKPDNENFVIIGGTNIYKIEDIINDATFTRIGGYLNNASYNLYNVGGVTHHPDIHELEFDPNNNDIFFSGTDGGVHKTLDINAATIPWVNLNNNYRTYQYYHVAMDPLNGSNLVLGGAQDNGTTIGGTDAGQPDNTTMSSVFGGDGVGVGISRINAGANTQLFLGFQSGPFYKFTNATGYSFITPSGSSSQFVTYFYVDPDNNNALYYAGQNILYMSTDSENVTTSNWTNMGALPTNQNIRTFATSPGAYNPASSYLLIGGQNGRIFRLDDPQNQTDLTSAVDITPPTASTANFSIVSGLAIHPTNPDIVLAVYANYGITNIFYTTNATASSPTWTVVERNLSSHSVRSAAIAEVGAETLFFVGTARGLYTTNDPLNTDWELEGQNEMGFALISGLIYRASDKKLLIGTHGNGMYETTVENTLSVTSFEDANNFIVYPNPTINELNFRSNKINFNESIDFEIIDLTGKVISTGKIQNKSLDVSSIYSGIYFIKLNINGNQEVVRFIKK